MACRSIARLCYFASIIVFINCVKIKIIDGPFSLNTGVQTQQIATPEVKLTSKVKPQALSGPPHLFSLAGKCFKLQKSSFKYELCPFHNVTQREQSYRWNAFHGVLGVWKEWNIVNDTFEYMLMTNGETCIGEIQREVLVYFKCGTEEKFEEIEEPRICRYNVTFQTPLACAEDAFMVYPTLSDTGRQEWDEIEDSFSEEEITVQGYHKRRRNLFIKESLLVVEEKKTESKTLISNSSDKNQEVGEKHKKFNKEQCIEEYAKLLEEVKELRLQLESYRKENETKFSKSSRNDCVGIPDEKSAKESLRSLNQMSEKLMLDTQGSHNQKSTNNQTEKTIDQHSRYQESRNQQRVDQQSLVHNQESREDEARSHKSRNQGTAEYGPRNAKLRNQELSEKERWDPESQVNKTTAKSSKNRELRNRGTLDQGTLNNPLLLKTGTEGNGIKSTNDENSEMQIKKSRNPKKGKMGDEGHSKQVPFKVLKKRKHGKMGDDGSIDSVKNHNKLKGHWLGRFLENARKRIDIKYDKKSEVNNEHKNNHIYH